MKTKQKSINIVSTGMMCELFSCSREWLRKLAKKGIIEKAGRMKWDRDDCTIRYIQHLRKQSESGTTDKFKEERALLTKAKREIEERKLKQMDGDLVSKKEIYESQFNFGREIRDNVMSISNRLAPLLAAETDPKTIKKILDDEHREVLTKLSE